MDAICVKICMTPEGITVSSEPLTEPPMNGEQVASVEEALAKAGQMLSGGGGGGAAPAPAEQQAERDFTAGFA